MNNYISVKNAIILAKTHDESTHYMFNNEKDVDKFLKECEKYDIKWRSGCKPTEIQESEIYRKSTSILIKKEYGEVILCYSQLYTGYAVIYKGKNINK